MLGGPLYVDVPLGNCSVIYAHKWVFSSDICVLFFAEKKLDSFITAQRSSDTETAASRDGDSEAMMNCSDVDVSPARCAANSMEHRQLPGTFSDAGSVSPSSDCTHSVLCSSLNESEIKTESGFDAINSGSPGEVECIDGQERCLADFRRNVDVRRVAGCRVNTGVAACKRDAVEIDRNCNELVPSGCKGDWDASHNEYGPDSLHSRVSDDQTSPSASLHSCVRDAVPHSDTPSRDTNVATDSLHAVSVVVTV